MERNKLIAACYLLLEKDNQYLLLRRRNTGYHDGSYSIVSGHVDAEESLINCVIREAKEEAGIIVSPKDLELVNVNSRNAEDGNRVGFFWKCSKWQGEAVNLEPDKCDDLSWFSKNNLPDNLVPELKSVLESLKNNSIYSELDWN